MPDIDLGGADAQRIRNRYQTSLQRDASDDEVTGWLSGSYGGGGVDAWENQIAQSDEARQRGTYRPPSTTPPDGTTVGDTGQNNTGQPQDTPPQNTQNLNGQSTEPASNWTPNDWYGAVGNIRSAYQSYLGRSASDQEVQNWLSGAYGYGNSAGAVQSMLEAIRNSPEARARTGYRPPNATPTTPPNTNGAYQDIAWWQQNGVSTSEIFDSNTGQLRPGWQRTARGYERTTSNTGTGTGWDADPKGNYQGWFLQNVGGLAPSGKALEGLAPYLAKYGIKLGPRNAGGMIDTVITPDGRVWDVIESATLDGGKRWQWIPAGGSGGSSAPGGTSTTPGVGGGRLPGNQYSDPYTQLLEGLIKSRIGTLQQPYNDPYRAQYEQAMQARANALGTGNAQLTQLMDYLQKRFTELQGPGYTGAENEVIRTGALDPIETDRQAARKRVMERLSARGLNPDSGIAQQALMEVDKQFDAMRGVTQNTLTTNDLARREDRQQRAERIGGQMVDINDARSREQLDVFQALELLSQTMRDEEASRSREAIGYAGSLNDLSMQRLQAAMQAAGMGGNPASLLSGLTSIAGLNQNAAALNRANSGSMWSGLGSIMAILAGSR